MRVCVLAQASPCTWVAHYVAAFRACCETVVVGPTPDSGMLRAWDRRDKAAHLITPNDIACDFKAEDRDLAQLLPRGWTPDLVVGIAGLGGDPLYRHTARLTCPTVFLSIDTWQCLLDYRQALGYDLVFAAQREFVEHLRATGSRHVFWLPLACDPEAHHPADADVTHDIGFAGSVSAPVHAERKRLLEALSTRFTVLSAASTFGDDMCALFGRCRLAFNHSAVQELNMRIFEVLAMGRALLTNHEAAANGLEDLFEDGKHLVVYRSEAELMEKAARYLADDVSRRAVAEAGRAEVLAKHTYAHRVQSILETVREYAPHNARQAAAAYQGDRLAEYLPTIPGVVADIGLTSGASKVALRRRGVVRFVGVAASAEDAARRRGSYDAVALWPEAWPEGVDTAILGDLAVLPCGLDDALARAHAMLPPGGTLVLRLRGNELASAGLNAEPATLGPWCECHDFHLRLAGPRSAGGGCILLARKRTRRLADVAAEVLSRLHVPELDLEGLLRRIPPGW